MTHTEKVKKVMIEMGVSNRSAVNIVYMLDWMTEKKTELKALWNDFKRDTGSNIPFDDFCYGLWPRCKNEWMSNKQTNKTSL